MDIESNLNSVSSAPDVRDLSVLNEHLHQIMLAQ